MVLEGEGHYADFNQHSGFEIKKANTSLDIMNIVLEKAYTTGNGALVNATNFNNTSVTITDSTIKNNIAEGNGGAIYSERGEIYLKNVNYL